MSNLKNFFNKVLNDNRIYTAEDIGNMSKSEFSTNEKAIDYQMRELGIPRENDLANNPDVVYVHSYTKDDGTKVKAHYRSKPDGIHANYQTNANLTGYAANIDSGAMKQINFSKLEETNLLAKFNADQNKNRPDARELMNLSLSGFKNLPEHREFSVFQPEAAEYVNNQLNIKNTKGLAIPNNWHGVIYDKNSGFAKRLSNSPELQSQVKAKYNEDTQGFTTNQILIDFKKDKNLNYSIGHGTILNPRIDKDGNFKAILFDKYDFDLHIKEYLNNPKITSYNNFMVGLQKFPFVARNYYVIIPIKFRIGE